MIKRRNQNHIWASRMLFGLIFFRLYKKIKRDADVKRILAKRMFAIKLTIMKLKREYRKRGKD